MIKACLFDITCILVSPSKNRMTGVDSISDAMGNASLDILQGSGGSLGLSPEEGRERVRENTKTYFEYSGNQMPDMMNLE